MTPAWRMASVAFAAGLLMLWQVLGEQGVISRVFFPPPSRALAVLAEWVSSGELWQPLGGTVWRTLAGWGAATILGVALGALIASSALTRDLFEPTIEFAARGFRSAEIFAGVFLLGALGYLGNAVLQRAEAYFLRWRPGAGIA